MNLSSDQQSALLHLTDFLERPAAYKRPYFVMHGLAGTGKTFLLAQLTAMYPGLKLAAYTGKAASVLRRRVKVPVSTVHAVIYDFKGLADDEDNPWRKNPIFTPKGEPLPGQTILIDEISMLGGRLAKDLLDTGARIIGGGDPGQLPPVRDTQFFTEADATLTEIHRQALDSPIIRQAHRIRNEGNYETDAEGFVVKAKPSEQDLISADIILCWRNRTRIKLNQRKRTLLGISGPLREDEPVMCLKNDHKLGLYNGAVYSVVDVGDNFLTVSDEDGRVIRADLATVERFDDRYEERRYNGHYTPFALAYASTVHKAQGSEYFKVVLYDECDDAFRRAFLYTGVTRAIEQCTVVRWRDG